MGLPPPDPHSLCPLSLTEFVEPPPQKKKKYIGVNPLPEKKFLVTPLTDGMEGCGCPFRWLEPQFNKEFWTDRFSTHSVPWLPLTYWVNSRQLNRSVLSSDTWPLAERIVGTSVNPKRKFAAQSISSVHLANWKRNASVRYLNKDRYSDKSSTGPGVLGGGNVLADGSVGRLWRQECTLVSIASTPDPGVLYVMIEA
jgi:hypothetical protein